LGMETSLSRLTTYTLMKISGIPPYRNALTICMTIQWILHVRFNRER